MPISTIHYQPSTSLSYACRVPRYKTLLVILLTIAMAALVILHLKHLNGPWYWIWSWRRLPWVLYPAMLVAGAPFCVAQWLCGKGKLRPALIALAIATLSLQ